ncbi:MAG: hypothetical protein QM727_00045 [Niabella sp.]
MDYAFAPDIPGLTGNIVNNMFTNRANTKLISQTGSISTVRDFIDELSTNASVTKPVDNIMLASHAMPQGFLTTAKMYRAQTKSTSYEVLDDIKTSAINGIMIPNTLIGYNAGNPVTHTFRIFGCNIGKATPFLNKLKEALGGNVKVLAPMHFDEFVDSDKYGVWEALCYEFRLTKKTAFASRADYIAALTAKGFTYYDGTAVTAADWNSWVPAKITSPAAPLISYPMGATIDKRTTISFKREFRYENKKAFTITITYANPASIPLTGPGKLADFQSFLTTYKFRPSDAVTAFDNTHPYPMHVRWGFTSLQDFVNGMDWKFSVNGDKMVCMGYYHEYTLLTPITDRSPGNAGNLIFNFYPAPASGFTAINKLDTTNRSFYAEV